MSRSSAARVAGSEEVKQLLRGVGDRVGLLPLELLTIVDPPPRDRDGMHARGLRRAQVERRVADVCGPARLGVHPFRSEEQRLRIRLVPFGFVTADNRLEEVAERDARER